MTEEKAREAVDDVASVWCETHEMEHYTYEHVDDCYQEMNKDDSELLQFDTTLQQRLEGTLAGITDPRAVRVLGDQGRAVAIGKPRATAGSGTRIWDETVEGSLYFGEDWMRKRTIEPGHRRVARAVGTSMEPTVNDGCSILVNLERTEFRDGGVFVAQTSDGVVARRAAQLMDGQQLGNDDGQLAPVPWQSAGVTGEVRWIGRTL